MKEEEYKYNKFVESLLSGNRIDCNKIADEYLATNKNVLDFYELIIKRAMYDIGKKWEFNHISSASEHLASSIVESIINKIFYAIMSEKREKKSIVLACVENEYHQIGIKMVGDVFEMYGWDAMLIGANTPSNDLIKFVLEIKPDLIALSLTLYFNLPILINMMHDIRAVLPNQLILIGGQAFSRGSTSVLDSFDNIIILNNLYNLETFIKERVA